MDCKVISYEELTDNYLIWPSVSDDHSTSNTRSEKQEHLVINVLDQENLKLSK